MYNTSKQGIGRRATAEEILERLPQEEIFEYYLGIPVRLGEKFCSPLRKDDNPTCNFSWYNGKLWFRDWADRRPKDVFGIVEEKYLVGFGRAVQIIAEDFGLTDVGVDRSAAGYSGKTSGFNKERSRRNSEKSIIGVKIQNFTKDNLEYLDSYCIRPQTAKYYNVHGVRTLWVNNKRIYDYNSKDPCLGYYFGVDKKGNQKWKIYFYKRRNGWRFISNTNRINGWVQIPETGKDLVITKSMKDVICLAEYGIPAVAMQAENQIPYDYIIDELMSRFNFLYTLYDFDRAGITAANTIRKEYGIPALFLTNGKFNTEDYGAKDISDYIRNFGYINGRKLTQQASDFINQSIYPSRTDII